MSTLVRTQRFRFLFFVLALVALFLVIAKIENLLVSVILSLVGAYLLSPAVDALERKGLSRNLAVTIPFVTVTLAIYFASVALAPMLLDQAHLLKDNAPKYIESISSLTDRLEAQLTKALEGIYEVKIKSQLQSQLAIYAGSLFQDLPQYISRSMTLLFLTPLLTFFMLVDGSGFRRKLLSLVPNNIFELVLNLEHQIASQLGGFIRARIIQSFLVGAIIWIGLMLMQFPYALVLAIVAAVLNIVPYVGPLIGALPAFVIAFTNSGNYSDFAALAAVYGLAQAIDAVLITPLVIAKIVNLHPITVILVILAGNQLMGILGMIICIPVFSALKVSTVAIYKHLTDMQS